MCQPSSFPLTGVQASGQHVVHDEPATVRPHPAPCRWKARGPLLRDRLPCQLQQRGDDGESKRPRRPQIHRAPTWDREQLSSICQQWDGLMDTDMWTERRLQLKYYTWWTALLLSQWCFCLHDDTLDWRSAFLLFATYYLPRVHAWPCCLLNICILYIYIYMYIYKYLLSDVEFEFCGAKRVQFHFLFFFYIAGRLNVWLWLHNYFCSAATLSFIQ